MEVVFDRIDTLNVFSQSGGIGTSDEDPRWGPEVKDASNLKAWFVFIQEFVMLIAIILTSCYIFCYQKNRTNVVLIQMALLAITYLGFNFTNTWKIISNEPSVKNVDIPSWIWIP